MAISTTLLVVVVTVIVSGSIGGGDGVDASTVPLPKRPVLRSSSSQPQNQEAPRISPSYSSIHPANPRVTTQPLFRSLGATKMSDNKQTTYSMKHAWGLSAGNSDSGPYTAGYGYISGRTLQQPVSSPKSDYELMERPSRQLPQSLFQGLTPAIQAMFGNGLDIKSMLLGGATTYAVTNLGMPDTISYLIPAMRWFAGEESTEASGNKDKIASVPVQEMTSQIIPESEKVEEVPSKKEEIPIQKEEIPIQKEEVPSQNEEASRQGEEAPEPVQMPPPTPEKQETTPPVEEVPNSMEAVPSTRRKRNLSVEPDVNLTQLATMVLTIIRSAECMQRSICILGSQIGTSNKGWAAFTLIDKLVPESVQGNQYFVTLKKAMLGGLSYCDRFRCSVE